VKRRFKRKGKHYVYILRCADKTFYTGYTPNLKRRVQLHNSAKGARYTRTRLPVKLIWHKKYKYFKLAFLAELKIKRLTRKQKEALVRGKRSDRVIGKAGK
jgi:putative endonuclease